MSRGTKYLWVTLLVAQDTFKYVGWILVWFRIKKSLGFSHSRKTQDVEDGPDHKGLEG